MSGCVAGLCYYFICKASIASQNKTLEHTHTDLQRVPGDRAGEAERVALSQNASRRNNSHCGCNCGERERERERERKGRGEGS